MFDDVESGALPVGLEGMAPGPELGALLSTIDLAELSGFDRVVVLRACQRMASHYQAQVYEAMASISDLMNEIDADDAELAADAASAEIRAALCLTRRAADFELGFAMELVGRVPRVWEALVAGLIDLRRARTLVSGTSHLPVETAREVVERIMVRACRLTTGQLAAVLRRLAIETDPDEAVSRYRGAVEERRVVIEPTVEGTANLLGLDLSPDRVEAVLTRIGLLARSLKTGGETRTMDQLRADVFLDLLEGTHHNTKTGRGVVDIHVGLDTLSRLSETPGELAGYGPVIADIARQVAERQQGAEWRWTLTDPVTGQPLDNGITRRRPSAAQRRQVQTRNRTCVFPGCRMPATACDLDHRIPWAGGGPTRVDHLVPACRHDHRIRHRAAWTHQPLPGGDHLWTSRLGHQYTTSGQPP
ncbi:MAG: DUF222 domain-containing protein [Acidimicrobiia bacterium]